MSFAIYNIPLDRYLQIEKSHRCQEITIREFRWELSKHLLVRGSDSKIANHIYNLEKQAKVRVHDTLSLDLVKHYGIGINLLMPELYEHVKFAVENLSPLIERVNIASFYYLKFKPET